MTGVLVVAAVRGLECQARLKARGLLGPAAALSIAYGVRLAELLGGVAGWRRDCGARRVHAARRALWRHMRGVRSMSWGEMAALLGVSKATLINGCRSDANVRRNRSTGTFPTTSAGATTQRNEQGGGLGG